LGHGLGRRRKTVRLDEDAGSRLVNGFDDRLNAAALGREVGLRALGMGNRGVGTPNRKRQRQEADDKKEDGEKLLLVQ